MKKDFQGWHRKKEKIHDDKIRPFFHEREIWFSSVGTNIGFEQDGKGERFLRPAIIIKKFNNEVLWVLPITRSKKTGRYYFSFHFTNGEKSLVILSQIRLIDAKRLEYKIGDMVESDFVEVKKKLKQFLD